MSSILTARIVNVAFDPSGRTYAYFTMDETIKAGDLVVVVTPRSNTCQFPVFEAPVQLGYPDQPALSYEEGEEIVVEGNARPWDVPAAPPPPPAPLGIAGYPTIARVVSTEETVEGVERVREWIVARLDFAEYLDRRAIEERRKVLVAKIERAAREARARLELDDLASRSPELKALLDEAAKLS